MLFNNNIAEHANNTKFLVVMIDSKLNWAAHILYIKAQFKNLLVFYSRLEIFYKNNTLRNMYFTFSCPYLIYCIEFWGKCSSYSLRSTNRDIVNIIRTITLSHYLAHTEPLLDI